MWLVLDFIILAILVTFAVIGAKRGLIRSLSGIAVTLIALIITFYFSQPLADFIQSTVVYHSLTERVNTRLSDYVADTESEEKLYQLFENDTDIDGLLGGFGVDKADVREKCGELIEKGEGNVRTLVCDYIVSPAAAAISKALAVAVTFIVSFLLLKLLFWLIGLLFKLPLLDGVNKFGGFLFGLVMGLIVCCFFCSVVGIALPYLRGAGIGIDEQTVKTAVIFSAVDRINPLSFIR